MRVAWCIVFVAIILTAFDQEAILTSAAPFSSDVDLSDLSDLQPSPVPGSELGEGFPGPFSAAVVDAAGTGGYTRRVNYYNEIRPVVNGVAQTDYSVNCDGDSYDMENGSPADMGTATRYASVYTDAAYNLEDHNGAAQDLTPCHNICNECKAATGNDCLGFIDMIRLGKCFFVSALVYTEASLGEPLENICRDATPDVANDADECRMRQRYYNAVKSYQKCPEGTFSDPETDWEDQYVAPGGGCKTCPDGWYSDYSNMGSTCTVCAAGRVSNPSLGFGACTVCDAGKYSDDRVTGVRWQCKTCENNKFSTQESPHCSLCPIGTYGVAVEQTDQYGEATECLLCGPGHYGNQEGQLACKDCPAGWQTNYRKATVCKDCVAGMYNEQGCTPGNGEWRSGVYQCTGEQAECKNCPLGRTIHGPNGGLPDGFTSPGVTSDSNRVGTRESCWNCQAGTYSRGAGEYPCTNCEVGKYVESVEQTVCHECQTGRYMDEQAYAACKNCPSGYFQDQTKAPDVTPTASNDYADNCIKCAVGQYSVHKPSATSEERPDIASFAGYGKAACQYCDAGTYADQHTQSVCKSCGAGSLWNGGPGSFNTAPGETQCHSCPGGWYQDRVSTPPGFMVTYCTMCPAGFSADNDRSSSCKVCSAGYYHELSGAVACKGCPAGHSSAGRGTVLAWANHNGQSSSDYDTTNNWRATVTDARYCVACEFGKKQGSAGQSDCETCPAGQYADHTTSTLSSSTSTCVEPGCLPVKPDAYTGANKCTSCSSGKHASSPGMVTICTDCAAGKYSNSCPGGCHECTDCYAGHYSDAEAANCASCPSGWFENDSGAANGCKNCPSGYHHDLNGQDHCKGCNQGWYTDGCSQSNPLGGWMGGSASCQADCLSCPAGKHSGNTASVCLDCSPGHFSNANADTCTACPTGWFENLSGVATSCKNCPSGYHQDSTTETSCRSCPSGYYADGCSQSNPFGATWMGSQASCQEHCSGCSGGKYARADTAPLSGASSEASRSVCTDCQPGQVSKEYAPNCEACPVGKTSSHTGPVDNGAQVSHHTSEELHNMCVSCPSGQGTDGATGQSGCKNCPNGKYSTTDMALCEKCPQGEHSNGASGSSGCKTCDAGRYGNQETANSQDFDSNDGNSCKSCPAGWEDSDNKHNCLVCDAGKKSNTNVGSTACTSCPTGQCSGGGGDCNYGPAHNCVNCPEGHYTNWNNPSSCSGCPNGHHSHAGWSHCTNCPMGHYAHTSWADCKTCNSGFYQSQHSQTSCYKCEGSREYQNQDGQSGCKDCSNGYYAGDAHNPSGWGNGNRGCLGCGAGKYGQTSGSTNWCKDCPTGRVNYNSHALTQSSQCTACPAGKKNKPNPGTRECSDCASGQYNAQGTGVCANCPAGQSDGDSDPATPCTSCPAGWSHQGTSSCHQCPNGYFQASSNQAWCSGCNAGQYQNAQGQSSCKGCPAGRQQGSNGFTGTQCDSCPPGYHQNQNSQVNCKSCPTGRFQDQTHTNTQCKSCPSGWQTTSTGQITCSLCNNAYRVPLSGSNVNGGSGMQGCTGDCDADSQCASGLKCFQRDGSTPVPGCIGSGTTDWDYCYDPSWGSLTSITLSGSNNAGATNLQPCVGECDADSQCAGDFKCFQRDGTTTTIPGCIGSGLSDWDYCYDPNYDDSYDSVLDPVPLSGSNDAGAVGTLQACIGECDADSQCAADLVCFQRESGESIPGCSGSGYSGTWDYCYDPNWGSQCQDGR